MQAADAADSIREAAEGAAESAAEQFRSVAALVIAIMAMLLAITSLGGGNVAEDMISANIHASDTWAFYQAKNVRQTANELAADELEAQLLIHGGSLTPAAKQALEEKVRKYRDKAARYEDEPDPQDPDNPLKGEGKKQLMARAKDWEAQREVAQKKDPNFDLAEALLQIAIVLGSVAILAMSRPVLGISIAVGALGFLLMLNGFFLLFPLPF
jgi:hypothetical protein